MGLTEYLGCLVPEENKDCTEALSSLGCALTEMKMIYQERVPYAVQEKTNELCLVWDDIFLALMRYAMSTDCMDNMTSQEREIWRYFVDFEDAYSTSATVDQCNGLADGATDKRILVIDEISYPTKSYPLYLADKPAKFMIYYDENNDMQYTKTPVIPMFPHYCLDEVAEDPVEDVPKDYVYDNLDSQFYNIHECLPYNICGCETDFILEHNDCHNPGDAPSDPDAIYDDLYKTGCGTGYCSQTINK